MIANGKLMDMLIAYAASHQHPVNVSVHMIGIPTIMLGALIPLSWANFSIGGLTISVAHLVVLAFFAFYLTLDKLFATVFLLVALLIAQLALTIGFMPWKLSASIAACAFFGGYAAQFIGHAVEKSIPVLVRHPIQANLAAPFFVIVEMFKMLGLREDLFDEVRRQIAKRRQGTM